MDEAGDNRRPEDRASLARPVSAGERQPGLRALGVAASRLAAPIIAQRGGGVLGRLKAEWGAIVGPDWADHTWPEALGGGALRLRVAPARALELQHRAPLLLERINLFFGRMIATRLAFIQAPLPLRPPVRILAPPPLSASEARALDARLAVIAEPELRDALFRLGRMVLAADGETRD